MVVLLYSGRGHGIMLFVCQDSFTSACRPKITTNKQRYETLPTATPAAVQLWFPYFPGDNNYHYNASLQCNVMCMWQLKHCICTESYTIIHSRCIQIFWLDWTIFFMLSQQQKAICSICRYDCTTAMRLEYGSWKKRKSSWQDDFANFNLWLSLVCALIWWILLASYRSRSNVNFQLARLTANDQNVQQKKQSLYDKPNDNFSKMMCRAYWNKRRYYFWALFEVHGSWCW